MRAAPPQAPVIAPLLGRIVAFVIDGLILSVFGVMIALAIGDPTHLDQKTLAALMAEGAVYNIGFLCAMSTTLGKMAMGLYVGDVQGRRLLPDRAILRYLTYTIANITVIGEIVSIVMAITDREQRRSLHDRVASTRVWVGRWSEINAPER